ncbi:hypothetical protein [Phytohabitans suffuscus]|uniref:Uncharacterized protein n=1 Tax=Phytohabitans suffuscus TaxID=624315 RepID=A0A6F8YAJ5_9ACTN|nr:hypothetical protein [Phytohabitans suffuscus]BCB83126.1 hypothetical protein Psuf_004390 [Phytohabitans suffuscus]
MDAALVELLDQLWAVVAYDRRGAGRRVRWSATHRYWLPSRAYGTGFVTEPIDNNDGQPSEESLPPIRALVQTLLRDRICQRCGLSDLEDHFVAPGIHQDLALYCVQLPDPSVVESFGGGGDRKHWGSIYGCSAVKPYYFTDSHGEEHVTFGGGMVASLVRDREWCSRCAGTAWNIAQAAGLAGVPVDTYVRDQTYERLRTREANRSYRRNRR